MADLCTPQSLYGPYVQTRFCGASIMSFSVSAGWNEQTSELTVDLVEDCSTTNKRIEYGQDLEPAINLDVDEFSEPHVGCAVYFRIGDSLVYNSVAQEWEVVRNPDGGFEFTGLIQSWNRKNDTGGNPTYSVKITDPRVILDQSHIIVSDLGERVFVVPPDSHRGFLAVPNVINVYGWLEALPADCRNVFVTIEPNNSYPTFIGNTAVGSLTGGFGGADVNQRGMRWNLLKKGLGILLSADQIPYVVTRSPFGREVSTDGYSPYGRLMYRGGGFKESTKTPGKIILPGSGVLGMGPRDQNPRTMRYMVDLTEIPFAPDHYRITGPTLTFTELITQVCEAAGCDYYVELLPAKGLGGGISLVIKVRVVQRREQPKLGEIQDYVDGQSVVVSKTFGQELANQPNSIFIFGAKRQDYVQQSGYPYIVPSGGLDTDGVPIRVFFGDISGTGSPNQWWYLLDFRQVEGDLTFTNPFVATFSTNGFAWVSETELRVAIGERDIWRDWVAFRTGGARTSCSLWLQSMGDGLFTPLIIFGGGGGVNNSPDQNGNNRADVNTMFRFLNTFATTFYGRKFLVNIPGVCRDYNFEATDASGFRPAPYYTDDPATDGGWPLIGSVLGLTMPSAALDFFALDESGKIGAMLLFNTAAQSTALVDPGDQIRVAGAGSYVKARVEPIWRVGTPDFSNNTEAAWAELEISGPVTLGVGGPIEGQRRLAAAQPGAIANIDTPIGTLPPMGRRLEQSINTGFVPDRMLPPNQAGVPLISRSRCYGPWGNVARGTINNDLYNVEEPIDGKLHVVHDEGFAPWEYGSYILMNQAAESAVELSITEMQVAERGQVTVPGYPNKRIGSALNTTDTESYNLILAPDNYDDFVFFKLDLIPPEGVKNVASSISNVNVNISSQGVQTEYSLSTFSPVFGRFAKSNADALKRLGQQRLRVQRGLRSAVQRAGGQQIGGGAVFMRARAMFGAWTPQSSSIWMAGRLDRWENSDNKRKEVVMQPRSDQTFYELYDNAALMSMDGLIRPVSKKGDGGLPKYRTSNPGCLKWATVAPPPPMEEFEPETILTNDLDPLSNPTTVDVDSIAQRSASPDQGHDIEEVARSDEAAMTNSTTGPSGSINLQDAVNNGITPGYTEDYRFMALRGPLVIQGWGYDTQGFPIPNAEVGDARTQQFADGWLGDATKWPVGPVDLRFDIKRGVWTVPPGYRVYKVRANRDIKSKAQGSVTVLDHDDIPSIAKESKKITVENITCETIPEDCEFLAYYDTVSCEYWPIFPGKGGEGLGIACSEEVATECEPGPMPAYDYKFIEFGENLYVDAKSADGKDGVLVSAAGGGVGLFDHNYCEYEGNEEVGVGADCTTVQCIGLGWGLEIAKAGITKNEEDKITEVMISAPNWIYTEGFANADSDKDLANKLVIGRGLCMEKGDECERIVRANIGIKNSSKCWYQDFTGIECESDGRPHGVVGIVAGAGISAKEESPSSDEQPVEPGAQIENEVWVHLQSDLKMTDCNDLTLAHPLVDIQLGCGLKGTASELCGGVYSKVKIDLDPEEDCGKGTIDIKVVCAIDCTDGGIGKKLQTLRFSKCGLFQGVVVGGEPTMKASEIKCTAPAEATATTSVGTIDGDAGGIPNIFHMH